MTGFALLVAAVLIAGTCFCWCCMDRPERVEMHERVFNTEGLKDLGAIGGVVFFVFAFLCLMAMA